MKTTGSNKAFTITTRAHASQAWFYYASVVDAAGNILLTVDGYTRTDARRKAKEGALAI